MTNKTLAWGMLVPFLLLTAYAVYQVGFVGIFMYQTLSPAGWQVFFDLVIALVLVLTWLIPDARRLGRNPWPWVIGTLFTGVIAPLAYIVTRPAQDQA